MRWRHLLPFVVLLTLAGSFAGSATAGGAAARPSVRWVGRTDQSLRVSFQISRKNGAPVISEMELEFHLKCEITGARVGLGTGFIGFDVPIKDNAFSFVFNDGTVYVNWTGEFDSPIHVNGSLAGALAQLTPDIQAELCASGTHAWQGHPASSAGAAPASAATMRITFTKDAAGRVHRTVEG
jgi:hypothetical protein